MSSEYKLILDEYCDCCGYSAPLKEFKGIPQLGEPKTSKFCEVCASTLLSNDYLRRSPEIPNALRYSLGWIANKILEEIRSLNGR